MQFPEKVIPEVERRIRKQFLNKLVPNYYSKFFQNDLIMFYKSGKFDFQLEKIQFYDGGGKGFFVKKKMDFF